LVSFTYPLSSPAAIGFFTNLCPATCAQKKFLDFLLTRLQNCLAIQQKVNFKIQSIFMTKTLFLAGLVCASLSANARNYYVSSAGNNANAGTSPTAPWQSLSKVNAILFMVHLG
jgi:hypothetical protein